MTASIQILPPDLASQIAAGEVVERPASIVKELLENSLDAGASRITVSIAQGGLSEITVSDNGRGMLPEDAPLCILRHATSKLRAIEDLDDLVSYGFRGEALPSISSVSRLRITTRAEGQDAGAELVAEGTTEPSLTPKGAPVGTTVTVRDLFFNVPARRKFLKSSNTESGHVTDVLVAAALCRPDVAFELIRDGRRVRHFPQASDRASRIAQIFEDEALISCSGQRGPVTVEAFLSRPERARQGALGLKLVINGRAVKDRALAATIAHAYGSVLERGRYPRGVLFLDLPGRLIDVNVHPQKVEIRFAEPRPALDAVHSIVSRTLASTLASAPSPAPPGRPVTPAGAQPPSPLGARKPDGSPKTTRLERQPWSSATVAETPKSGEERPHPSSGSLSAGGSQEWPRVLRDRSPPVSGVRYERPLPREEVSERARVREQLPLGAEASGRSPENGPGRAWKNLRFLSQVRQTFLICEGDDGLYILDQHAAAERVIFSKLSQSYENRDIATQALLFPVICDINSRESEVLEERREDMALLGLDVRVRSAEQASVHAVPKILAKKNPEELLRDLLRELARSGERAYSDAVDKVLATMACHAAVRAGDVLGAGEAQALLEALDGANFAGYCPHGRPIVAELSWLELERKVGRR